jgi:hypothetical protein
MMVHMGSKSWKYLFFQIEKLIEFTLGNQNFPNFFVDKWLNFARKKKHLRAKSVDEQPPVHRPLENGSMLYFVVDEP